MWAKTTSGSPLSYDQSCREVHSQPKLSCKLSWLWPLKYSRFPYCIWIVGSVWFQWVLTTRTNHMLSTEYSNAMEIRCTQKVAGRFECKVSQGFCLAERPVQLYLTTTHLCCDEPHFLIIHIQPFWERISLQLSQRDSIIHPTPLAIVYGCG